MITNVKGILKTLMIKTLS